jgi:hypothetical protein
MMAALLAPLAGFGAHLILTMERTPVMPLLVGACLALCGLAGAYVLANGNGRLIMAAPEIFLATFVFLFGFLTLLFARALVRNWPVLAALALIAFTFIDLRFHNGPNHANAASFADMKAQNSFATEQDNPILPWVAEAWKTPAGMALQRIVKSEKATASSPSTWLAEDAEILSNRAEILQNGFPETDFLKNVFLEGPPAKFPHFPRSGEILLKLRKNTEVEIETRHTNGGYLVLAEAWHPWWRASIDNEPVNIYRADLVWRAVIVPPGSHVVRFKFSPFCGLLSDLNFPFQCRGQ